MISEAIILGVWIYAAIALNAKLVPAGFSICTLIAAIVTSVALYI